MKLHNHHHVHQPRLTPAVVRQAQVDAGNVRRSDCFDPRATNPNQVQVSGNQISGPGVSGSFDADFNFTLTIGGQEVKGNLFELLVVSILENALSQVSSGTGGAKLGDVVSANGNEYVVEHSGSELSGVKGTTSSTRAPSVATSGSRAEAHAELDKLPIWTSEWSPETTATWKDRMMADKTPLPQQLAALDRYKALMTELHPGREFSFNTGWQTGSVQNLFTSGTIYNDRFYTLAREEKAFITGEYQRLLGRNPTEGEYMKWNYLNSNLEVTEQEFAKLKDKFSRMTAGDLNAAATQLSGAAKFTDKQVFDGVQDYLKTHPQATEAEIRQVAQSQYGVSKEQLDRVKNTYFSQPSQPAPSTTQPARPAPSPTFTDKQVYDGVQAYLASHPGASEAEIRSVAQSQYGVSTAQLDRVKATYFR